MASRVDGAVAENDSNPPDPADPDCLIGGRLWEHQYTLGPQQFDGWNAP
jgi:hypothetical protein